MRIKKHSFDENGTHWLFACRECQRQFAERTSPDEIAVSNERSMIRKKQRIKFLEPPWSRVKRLGMQAFWTLFLGLRTKRGRQ